MRNLIIHHVDMDGYTSAYIAGIRNRDDFYAAQYGEGVENAIEYALAHHDSYDMIGIVDLSINEAQGRLLNELGNVVQYDHHPVDYKTYDWQNIVIGESTTKILYEELGCINDFYRAVNAADIFDKNDVNIFNEGRQLTWVLNSLDVPYEEGLNTETTKYIFEAISNSVKDIVEYCNSSPFTYFPTPKEVFFKYLNPMGRNLQIQAQNTLNEGTLVGSTLYVININGNPSDISDFLISQGKINTMVSGSTERHTVALRGANARNLALRYGGGGHEVAAGCKVDSSFETVDDLIELFENKGASTEDHSGKTNYVKCINEIYEDIGTCKNCKYADKIENSTLLDCTYFENVTSNFYCGNFIKKPE